MFLILKNDWAGNCWTHFPVFVDVLFMGHS